MQTKELIEYKKKVDSMLEVASATASQEVNNLLVLLAKVLDSSLKDRLKLEGFIPQLEALQREVDQLVERDDDGEDWKRGY